MATAAKPSFKRAQKQSTRTMNCRRVSFIGARFTDLPGAL
jgi:hypothetical protein